MKIKKNDLVKMLAGKDSGKTGKVLRVFPDEKKVVVDGLNMLKKHNRPRREGEKGQRIEMPRKVDISNAMLVCSKCSKPTKVAYKTEGKKKTRVCKKCKAEI
ncbi:MAG TPA: 50S ribosomal protein L24 [Candidatus Moranbacteria bacterium]|nr:50S ribosomal protein L24 [Candidatus Moranbacteria bacterium]HAT74746.1 50S ribosomal protein L24 [Candidatus Moranbacteria bacterium]